MASPHWVEQFAQNQAIIARASNERNPKYDLEIKVPNSYNVIASCGHVCHVDELVDDWCPKCCHMPECDKEIS